MSEPGWKPEDPKVEGGDGDMPKPEYPGRAPLPEEIKERMRKMTVEGTTPPEGGSAVVNEANVVPPADLMRAHEADAGAEDDGGESSIDEPTAEERAARRGDESIARDERVGGTVQDDNPPEDH